MTSTSAVSRDLEQPHRECWPIVCGVDDRYTQTLCVLFESLAAAHPTCTADLRLIVLHCQLSNSSQRRIRFHAERLGLPVQLRAVPAPDYRYPVSGWVSDAVYLRLSIPDAVGDEPAVLYLDADILVMRDLRPLLRRAMSGAPVAAVRDPQNPLLGQGIAMPGWHELGLPADREYFNTGVMLLDLDQCRQRGIFECARRFLSDHPGSVRFWDQDALNWSVGDDWLRLERTWNSFALSPLAQRADFVHYAERVIPLAQLIADEQTAAVLHFAGPDKPWDNGYPEGRIRDLYRRFLESMTKGEGDAAPGEN